MRASNSGIPGGTVTQIPDERWLEALRERGLEHARARPPRISRGKVIALVIFAILLHVLAAFWLSGMMRLQPSHEDASILVDLIAAPPPEPALPQPPPLPIHAITEQPRQRAPAAPARSSARMPAPATPSTNQQTTPAPLVIYNKDGSLNVPKDLAAQVDAAKRPNFYSKPHEQGMERARELMARGHNLLHCHYDGPDSAPTGNDSKIAAAAAALHMIFDNPGASLATQGANAAQAQAARAEAAEIAQEKINKRKRLCDDNLWTRPTGQPADESKQTPDGDEHP